jgi:hypothetical protein
MECEISEMKKQNEMKNESSCNTFSILYIEESRRLYRAVSRVHYHGDIFLRRKTSKLECDD